MANRRRLNKVGGVWSGDIHTESNGSDGKLTTFYNQISFSKRSEQKFPVAKIRPQRIMIVFFFSFQSCTRRVRGEDQHSQPGTNILLIIAIYTGKIPFVPTQIQTLK